MSWGRRLPAPAGQRGQVRSINIHAVELFIPGSDIAMGKIELDGGWVLGKQRLQNAGLDLLHRAGGADDLLLSRYSEAASQSWICHGIKGSA